MLRCATITLRSRWPSISRRNVTSITPMSSLLNDKLSSKDIPVLKFKNDRKHCATMDGTKEATGQQNEASILSPKICSGQQLSLDMLQKLREGKLMVLSIETSFDDTAAAVVKSDGTILARQERFYKSLITEDGGIIPMKVGDMHRQHLGGVIAKVMNESGITGFDDIDLVAYTAGPGLGPSLMAGRDVVQDLCVRHSLPAVPVNHLEAHMLTDRRDSGASSSPLKFPYVHLLASGANCTLVLAENVGHYYRLGTKLDEAPGEFFDKVARDMGLPIDGPGGGGGEIERRAALSDLTWDDALSTPFSKTVPLYAETDCHFSFSGLRTQINRGVKKLRRLHESGVISEVLINDLSRSILFLVTAHLMQRADRALAFSHEFMARRGNTDGMNGIVFSGGVASNKFIRTYLEQLCDRRGLKAIFPSTDLCQDNAVMIAYAALERLDYGYPDVYTPEQTRWAVGLDISGQVSGRGLKTASKLMPMLFNPEFREETLRNPYIAKKVSTTR